MNEEKKRLKIRIIKDLTFIILGITFLIISIIFAINDKNKKNNIINNNYYHKI